VHLDEDTGQVVSRVSAAVERARLNTALRVHVARLANGIDEEMSVDAEAGAVLEAEMACDIARLRAIADSWVEANNKAT